MIWEYIQIFFIGILEDFLSSFNTKTIQRNNQLFSFLISFISVILWYYVIVIVVDNIHKFWLIVVYATGGGLGDIVTIRFDRQIQRFERRMVGVFKKIRLRWPIEFKGKNKSRLNKAKSTKKRGIKCRKLSA